MYINDIYTQVSGEANLYKGSNDKYFQYYGIGGYYVISDSDIRCSDDEFTTWFRTSESVLESLGNGEAITTFDAPTNQQITFQCSGGSAPEIDVPELEVAGLCFSATDSTATVTGAVKTNVADIAGQYEYIGFVNDKPGYELQSECGKSSYLIYVTDFTDPYYMFVRNKASPTTSYYGIYCDWSSDDMDFASCDWQTEYFVLSSSVDTCECGRIEITN